jgi:Protein of unknown function (DUF2905)
VPSWQWPNSGATGSHGRSLMGKALVLIGLAIAALGVLVMLGVPFGRLPGDVYIRRGSFTFYFPAATSIILSILLTLLIALFRR